ncbi:UDP-glucose 6-dehydrogenase [Candidatus Marinamargulisbacteria bacterium SCGC AAA071-K20]|nr:UDP-glucose 6-dehydrogenase [Candidatus Marinamargulisbacteria bacterium SCGC AAA071-K20]
MKLAVVGTGYVGLVSGVCFADLGHQVICVDNVQEKLDILNRHEIPFFEPELKEKLVKGAKHGVLVFSSDIAQAIKDSTVILSAVGTPPKEDGCADVSAVFSVIEEIIAAYKSLGCTDKKVIVNKSTVPVGTGRKIIEKIKEAGLSSDQLSVVSNPEFLREGTAVYDFFHTDRIVIGADDPDAKKIVGAMYGPLYSRETPIVYTDLETAELSKYAANCFLATKISFINEMARYCEKIGADVKDVAKIMGMDGRISKYFLHAGPGYGGSCFSKDIRALIGSGKEVGLDLQVIREVESVNEDQKVRSVGILKEVLGDLAGKKIGFLGLAFKPNTDDMREAPSLKIIKQLLEHKAEVIAFDPESMSNTKAILGDRITYGKNAYDVAEDVDAIILITEWHVFRNLDIPRLKKIMKQAVFFDLRNVYDVDTIINQGFKFYSVGRRNNL